MSRKKLKRFEELATFSNAFTRESVGPGGKWLRDFFGNDRPIILELGCGKGEYSLALARLYPDRSILGVDRKGERVWKGAKVALDEGLSNVAFLRAKIEDLEEYLDEGQVEQIWMPFPDPLPKKRQVKHRLVSPAFLEIYRRLLGPSGCLRIKSDDRDFIDYAVEVVEAHGGTVECLDMDIHAESRADGLLAVQTTFESRHIEAGRTIKYLSCRLT